MIPPHIQGLLNAWIQNDEWVEEKPHLKDTLLMATLKACRDDPPLAGIIAGYVLERIECVESH